MRRFVMLGASLLLLLIRVPGPANRDSATAAAAEGTPAWPDPVT